MRKADYIVEALRGLRADRRLADAALYFWHSEVPLEDAKRYLEVLSQKLRRVA